MMDTAGFSKSSVAYPILDIHDGVAFEENPLELLLRIKDIYYGREAFRELRMYELLASGNIGLVEHFSKLRRRTLILSLKSPVKGRDTGKSELRMYELLLRFFIVVGKHNTLRQSEISALKTDWADLFSEQ